VQRKCSRWEQEPRPGLTSSGEAGGFLACSGTDGNKDRVPRCNESSSPFMQH
jgi:hypothetical protein